MNTHSNRIQRTLLAAVLIAALLVGFGGMQRVQAAGPWFVSTTGNDTNDCLTETTACATINGAFAKADPGDTINVMAGSYDMNSAADRVIINKAGITIQGAGSTQTFITTSAPAEAIFQVMANDVALTDLSIEKTDNASQDIIYVQADGFTLDSTVIFGHYVFGTGEVSRAMVVSYGSENLTITNNTFHHLRQPGYFNGSLASPTTGTVSGNHTAYTRGWVIDGANFTFTANTWGTGVDANVFDVAILAATPAAYYTDLVAVSGANNDAVIEDQRVDPALLTVVHVDDSAATAGNGGPSEPYPTINQAFPRVMTNGKILVAAGTYVEEVIVNKPVEIAGAGEGLVTVLPSVSSPNPCTGSSLCSGAVNVFLVQANNVTIHDLTIDGDNPALTSGIVRNGADIDARNGIITNHAVGTFTNLTVRAVTVKNIYLRGIYMSTDGSFLFEENTVENVAGDAYSIGIFAWYGPGIIRYNTVSYANDAIAANHSRGITFWYNTVTNSGSGIHSDNNGSSGSSTADYIQGNTVSDCYPDGYGIWTFAPYQSILVRQNIVTNCAIGLSAWGQLADVNTTFRFNTVTGPNQAAGSVGIYVTTDLISWGYTDVTTTLQNNYVSNFETGILLTGDQQDWNPEPYVAKTINATIFNNSLENNLTGLNIGTTGTYNANASGNWWGTTDAVEVDNLINDAIDYSPWLNSGVDTDTEIPSFQGDFAYLNVDDNSPQFGTIGYIQEAMNMASSGGTVNVWDGTYYGGIMVQKPLTVKSQNGAATTVIHGGLTTPAIYVVSIRANDVTLDGFTVTNPLYMLHNADLTGIMIGYYGDNNLSNIAVVNNIVTEIGSAERALDTTADYPSIGIVVNGVVNGLEIANNTLHNIHQTVNDPAVTWGPSAIGMYGYDTSPLSTNVSIHDNEIYNISATNAVGVNAISNGIRFGWGSGDGIVANNLIHDVDGRGIQLNTYNNGAVNITANEIYNASLVGIAVDNPGGGTITGNNIHQNGAGITVSAGVTAPVVAHFNRIAGNTTGIDNLSAIALDAENNWWGCNAGPADAACDAVIGDVDADPWLVLTFTADQTHLLPGGVVNLAANLKLNSVGADTSASGLVPDGIPVAFTTTYGTLDPLTASLIDAAAAATLAAPDPITVLTTTATATIDNQVKEIVFTNNLAPVATDLNLTAFEDSTLTGTLTATDPNDDPLSFALGTLPLHGTVTLNASTGAFTYTPTADYNGPDSFTFTVSDGELSDTGQVTIDVQPVNDNPVLPALTDVTWLARTTSSLILPEATDVEGDPLTYTVTLENGDALPAWLNFDAGTLTLSGTPGQENVGIYQIKVRVEDGNSGSVEGVFTLTVESNLLQVFLPIIFR